MRLRPLALVVASLLTAALCIAQSGPTTSGNCPRGQGMCITIEPPPGAPCPRNDPNGCGILDLHPRADLGHPLRLAVR